MKTRAFMPEREGNYWHTGTIKERKWRGANEAKKKNCLKYTIRGHLSFTNAVLLVCDDERLALVIGRLILIGEHALSQFGSVTFTGLCRSSCRLVHTAL